MKATKNEVLLLNTRFNLSSCHTTDQDVGESGSHVNRAGEMGKTGYANLISPIA